MKIKTKPIETYIQKRDATNMTNITKWTPKGSQIRKKIAKRRLVTLLEKRCENKGNQIYLPPPNSSPPSLVLVGSRPSPPHTPGGTKREHSRILIESSINNQLLKKQSTVLNYFSSFSSQAHRLSRRPRRNIATI